MRAPGRRILGRRTTPTHPTRGGPTQSQDQDHQRHSAPVTTRRCRPASICCSPQISADSRAPPSHSSRHRDAPHRRRGSTPRAGSTAARDEHLRQLATLSVARPVAVMVTRDRRHAAMIPARPRPFHAARHVSRPFLNDEHPQLGDDAEDRAGHRTVERVDEHGPEPVPEEERELREDYPGDEDRSANRPQSAQKVLQGVIESRSKL